MTLQAKLDAFKADFEAGKPPYNVPRAVIETMHRATKELIDSGAAGRALKAGDKAPLFTLKDQRIYAGYSNNVCAGSEGVLRLLVCIKHPSLAAKKRAISPFSGLFYR